MIAGYVTTGRLFSQRVSRLFSRFPRALVYHAGPSNLSVLQAINKSTAIALTASLTEREPQKQPPPLPCQTPDPTRLKK